MPMRRISSAVHSAQRFTSAACCGSALMLGIARYAFSSSTYLSRLVLMKSMTEFMSVLRVLRCCWCRGAGAEVLGCGGARALNLIVPRTFESDQSAPLHHR